MSPGKNPYEGHSLVTIADIFYTAMHRSFKWYRFDLIEFQSSLKCPNIIFMSISYFWPHFQSRRHQQTWFWFVHQTLEGYFSHFCIVFPNTVLLILYKHLQCKYLQIWPDTTFVVKHTIKKSPRHKNIENYFKNYDWDLITVYNILYVHIWHFGQNLTVLLYYK